MCSLVTHKVRREWEEIIPHLGSFLRVTNKHALWAAYLFDCWIACENSIISDATKMMDGWCSCIETEEVLR